MKPKLRWLLLLLPLALFAWAWQAASWRPKIIGAQKGATPADVMTEGQLLISPDGKRLVSFALWRLNRTNSVPGRGLTVWNLSTRRAVWQQKSVAVGWMKPLAFSPDSRLLAVISDADAFGRPNRVIDILDAANGKLKRRIVSLDDREIQSAAFASNSALAVATSLGAAVIDVKTGEPIRRWRFGAVAFVGGPRVYAPQSAISADGKTILALANGRDVTLYDATTGQKTRAFTLDKAHRDPRLSPDGKLWAMSLDDINLPSFYDARTGKKLVENLAYGSASRFQFWDAGSSRIVSPTPTKLAILDGRSAARVREVPGNLNAQTIALDPRGGFYYTLDKTGVIWRWRLR